MRQPPLLRWIEKAEARKAAVAFNERVMIATRQAESGKGPPSPRRPRLLRPLLRKLRPARGTGLELVDPD